jgi:signal peptidase I
VSEVEQSGQVAAAPRVGSAAWVWEWAKSILVALVLWLVLRTFVFEAFRITSGSMERTMLVGDWLFVNRALYGAEVPFVHRTLPKVRDPQRGDIVVFDSKLEPITLVKRLLGVPGDTLAMRNGVLYRNSTALSEPYAQHTNPTASADPASRQQMRAAQLPLYVGRDPAHYEPDVQSWGPIVVPKDSLFFLGDNRDESYDSRYWGVQARDKVRGRAMFVYYSYDPESWRPLPYFSAIRWGRLFTALR